MKVNVELTSDIKEPYAVIYTNQMTEEISQIMELFSSPSHLITGAEEDRIVVIKPEEIFLVRVEDTKAIIYCKDRKFVSNRRLYELESTLGRQFMRISKFSLINLSEINCLEPSFNGTMMVSLKNGEKDYISRKYLPQFKAYLGL